MYAIVKTGGKQYRVEQGQTLLVERLPQEEGATVNLEPLLLRSDDTVFDAAGLAKVEVQAKIVGHERGPKLRVFKFKPKRGYKRRTGHRQELTRLEVTKIGTRAARASTRAAAEPAAPKPASARGSSAAAAGTAEKAPTARRSAAAAEGTEKAPSTRAPRRTTTKKNDDGS